MEYRAKEKPKDNMTGKNKAILSNYSIDNMNSNYDKNIVENGFLVSLGIKNIYIHYRKINAVNFAII